MTTTDMKTWLRSLERDAEKSKLVTHFREMKPDDSAYVQYLLAMIERTEKVPVKNKGDAGRKLPWVDNPEHDREVN